MLFTYLLHKLLCGMSKPVILYYLEGSTCFCGIRQYSSLLTLLWIFSSFFSSFDYFLIGGKLLYAVVLISAVQQCKSVIIYITLPSLASLPCCHPTPLGHHRAPCQSPCNRVFWFHSFLDSDFLGDSDSFCSPFAPWLASYWWLTSEHSLCAKLCSRRLTSILKWPSWQLHEACALLLCYTPGSTDWERLNKLAHDSA